MVHGSLFTFSVREEQKIKLNFEDLRDFDALLVRGYDDWVENAPEHWKADGFLSGNSPVVVTSRYGQNAEIALPNNQQREAVSWELDRDYSKIAFLTFALATKIECVLEHHLVRFF